MNKIFKTMMLAAITAFGMASCEDVPAPFVEPEQPGTEEIVDAKGSGTLADPFNVPGVINYVKELGADVESPEQVYIKGVVCSTSEISPQFGNATFDINVDASSVKDAFTVYRAKGLKNKNISSEDEVQVGDTVIVCGKVVYYKGNTPETVQGKAHIHWQKRGNKVLDGSETDTPDTPAEGGTWDKPYTVAEAIANQTGNEVWVHAYIVGSIPADASSTVLENMTFTADGANHTNLCIADVPGETNYANCAPVQLPSGSDARANLNLKDNPSMLGKEVWLKGKTTKYCGAPGLKEISKYTLTKPTAADDEETGDAPAEGAKGDGSLENPFNAAGAHNFTAALTADQATTEKFYIKGIVCESNKMDISVQYKNATFHVSDDGTTNGAHFLIFRTKGLNGADITSEDDVKVGDEVVVYAQLINYKGNTPETNQGGIIYSQKRNGQDMGGNGEEDTPGEGQGDGSFENPYNLAAIWAMYENGNPEGTSVHVKGIISKVKSLDVSKWERAQYYISDDGTENGQFQIYNGYYLNGQPFTANDQIKVGDEVIVYGELSSYNGTPQIGQNSKIVSINGQTEGGDTPGEDDNEDEDIPAEGNILQNGDFELWEGGLPTNWKSASTAGNVELTQSTEAHGGTYAVSLGYVENSNKRMAYKETTLPAGTYKFSFYAKGTDTTEGSLCQTRPGYVPMKADGSADSSNYKYGDYASLSATEWTLVEHEFTLANETTLCLVIMSPKGTKYHTSQNILVDDATLVKVN